MAPTHSTCIHIKTWLCHILKIYFGFSLISSFSKFKTISAHTFQNNIQRIFSASKFEKIDNFNMFVQNIVGTH